MKLSHLAVPISGVGRKHIARKNKAICEQRDDWEVVDEDRRLQEKIWRESHRQERVVRDEKQQGG
jgi:hypothetical protein